ncbi:retinol dehydrogenase 11-like [Hydra vulgaris]|uniref:retinol dehydrogenase 11-like n=1 Tax=Hydra vulgaris TaxID=6087 RepID=UPI0032EA0F31
MLSPYWKTKEGFEMQIGVNYFGHFFKTNLHVKKRGSWKNYKCSRVHGYGSINFDDINSEKSSNSVKANWLTFFLLKNCRASCYGLLTKIFYATAGSLVAKTSQQGDQTSIYCATKEGLEEHAEIDELKNEI